MNHIKALGIIIVLFYYTPIYSQETSKIDAQRIAKNWIAKVDRINTKTCTIEQIIDKSFNNELSYRVINFNEGGYVIVNGETGLHPVIAYSKTGHFNKNHLTQDEKDWLVFVEIQIANFRTRKKLHLNSTLYCQDQNIYDLKSVSTFNSVPPLFETYNTSRWAGWYPYSIEMPYQNGNNSCVPLAMAQIMKYYNFPLQGTGTHSYTWYNQSTPETLSVNFSDELYCFDNMPFRLTYCGNGTDNCNDGSFDIIPGTTTEQMEEIGKLIYHCGITVGMIWQGQATTGGGTYGNPGNWVQAMEDHFSFANSWTYLNDTYIAQNHDSFKSSLRNELNNGRPVLFAYYGNYWTHGHALVVDGYEDDDYFHFAFGRGGADDAYYYLYSIDDDGSHDALPYTAYYRAAIGIEPDCTTASNLNLNNITISTTSSIAYNAINEINFSSTGAYFIIDGNGTTGGKVIAQVENSVNLNPGFEVKKGGEFVILIGECGTP